MIQWFRETFGPPSVRCERLGHVLTSEKIRYYAIPSKLGGVADIVVKLHTKCSRCDKDDFPTSEVKRYALSHLRIPADVWENLQDMGMVRECGGEATIL